MPFPDLVRKVDLRKGPNGESVIWAEAQGVPDNGNNTFAIPFIGLGIPPGQIDEDWMTVIIQSLGPAVTTSAFVSLSADKTQMTFSFAQAGADQAIVTVGLIHSLVS